MEKRLSVFVQLFCCIIMITSTHRALAQQNEKKVRIAKIEVYPEFLNEYNAALAEQAKAAVKAEPGVLALQAVYDIEYPTLVTVFEIYASEEDYQKHLKAPHFLKYKNSTLKMVKSLDLVEVSPVAIEIKPELTINKS